MSFSKKKILVGICGSIAAYKSLFLIRRLREMGTEVQVIMTDAAKDFVTPLSFATLSKNPVYSRFIADPETGQWNNHVDLGLWADLMLVAPATSATLAKFASGSASDLLSGVYLSSRCPVFIAPAMDHDMYQHPAVQKNLDTLRHFGHTLIEAETGELASGIYGKGRMAEPENIISVLNNFFRNEKKAANHPLKGKKALVTAGPTYEALDPVRFIGNRSSGKMGFAIAQNLAEAGVTVNLVCGPVQTGIHHPNITLHPVTSAEEMMKTSAHYFEHSDINVFAAAVSDYRPQKISPNKIKKGVDEDSLQLTLVKNPDIAFELGKKKVAGQINVGFALETNDGEENAKTKLKRKHFDFIVLNNPLEKGAGFQHDTNQVTIINEEGKPQYWPLQSKQEVAKMIVDMISEKMQQYSL